MRQLAKNRFSYDRGQSQIFLRIEFCRGDGFAKLTHVAK